MKQKYESNAMELRKIKSKTGGQLLDIEIRSKRGLLFAGKADAVSSKNEAGQFDILPLHSNFITLIDETIVIHKRTFGGEEMMRDEFPVRRGVIRVAENKVKIFLSL